MTTSAHPKSGSEVSDINDPETLAEAQKMLDWVKERIAGGPVKGQAPSRPFNPYED